MKALHVQIFCCEGIVDLVHGGGNYTNHIFIPDENLLMSYKDGSAYIAEGTLDDFTTSSFRGGLTQLKPKIIREIEVPESVITAARTLITARETFTKVVGGIWKNSIGR